MCHYQQYKQIRSFKLIFGNNFVAMIYCYPGYVTVIIRSKHYLISLLKNPSIALKKIKRATNKRRKLLTNNEVLDAFDAFPKEFYRKTFPNTKMARQLYIVNEATATKIGQHLSSSDPNITIVEANPGFGLLTKALLHNGMNDLRLFEGRKEFMTQLQEKFSDVYPERVKLIQGDLLGLHKSVHADNEDRGSRVDTLLSGLPTSKWQDDINFRLFGATGSTTFFKHLIQSIVHQNSIMSLGRCELYMAIPSSLYFDLMSSNEAGYIWYRGFAILFQIFFEYELLDKFSRAHFLPNISNKTEEKSSKKESISGTGRGLKCPPIDPDLVYFVKIVPRRNLYQFCPANQIQELWHFIKHFCISRTNRIIPSLEEMIPGCGASLLLKFDTADAERSMPIKVNHLCELPSMTNPPFTLSKQDYYDNLNIYTQFGDLQPVELLTLFYEFRMLPEYSSSSFLPSLDSVLIRHGVPSDGIEMVNSKTSNQTNNIGNEEEES